MTTGRGLEGQGKARRGSAELGKDRQGSAGLGRAPFEPSRADGRSDKQVIYDLTHHAEPGTVFSHDVLIDALSEGLDVEVDRRRVYPAVAAANNLLLPEHQRYLHSVTSIGYKMLRAEEHLPVALGKRDIARTYIQKGIELLQHVRLDEIPEPQRPLHQGQLMVMVGLNQAVRDSERRHDQQEQVIDELRRRIDRLEGRDEESS